MSEEMNKDLEINEVAPETVIEDAIFANDEEVVEEKPKKEKKAKEPKAKKEKVKKEKAPKEEETEAVEVAEQAPAEVEAAEAAAEVPAEEVAPEEQPKAKKEKVKKEKVKKEKKKKSELDNEEPVAEEALEAQEEAAPEAVEAVAEETTEETEEEADEAAENEAEVLVAEETPEEKEAKRKKKKRLIITGICAGAAVVVAAVVVLILILSAKATAIKSFNKAAAATTPTKVSIAVSQTVLDVPLEASFVTSYNEDGSFVINYFYDEINTSSVDADGLVSRKEGVVTCDASGNYSDGGEFEGSVSAPKGNVKFNFESSKIKYKLTFNSNILKATVKASNTKSVFGIDVGSDIDVTVTKAAGKIVSFTMNYTTAEGPVTVNCFYAN